MKLITKKIFLMCIFGLLLTGIVFAAKGGVKGKPSDGGDDGTNPSVPECSDNIDNDGDGFVDYDGYCKNKKFCYEKDPGCTDANDNSENTCVPENEICDGIDNDCNGNIDENVCPQLIYFCDSDDDTFISETLTDTCNTYNCIPVNCQEIPGTDCNDNNKNTNPSIIENCDSNLIDNDCDGLTDECSCQNSIFDIDYETDVDCGNTCPKCSEGKTCSTDSDCLQGLNCIGNICTPTPKCKELYPGLNDPQSDRVNVVFIGLSYSDIQNFIVDADQAVDYYSNHQNVGPGVLELNIFKDNKEKFNFWYVDKLFTPSGDPTSSCTGCYNSQAYQICGGLPNTYYANFCDISFRSCAYLGGESYNSVAHSDWPYTFDHEFMHQFPELADEYVEPANGDRSRPPNCAPDLETAQTWWGDLNGLTGQDGLTIGYFDGCSYVTGNYRPTSTSIMRNRANYKLGLVNERHVEGILTSYSGNPVTSVNAVEVTLVGKPNDISSYIVADINYVKTPSQQKRKGKKYSATLKFNGIEKTQTFDTYDYLAIDDFSSETLRGELVEIPKTKITVIIPTGNHKFDKKTKLMIGPNGNGEKLSLSLE